MNIPEQITGLTDRPQAWWSEAPQPQKFGVMGGGAALLIALIVAALSFGGGDDEWEPAILYAGLDYEEAAQITTRLAAMNIPHKITEEASTILVPQDQVANTRLTLAGEGFPRSGRQGYSIFDESQIAMTEFLQNVNFKRAIHDAFASI